MTSLAPQLRRDTHTLWVRIFAILISLYPFNSFAQNGSPCYKPIIGPGTSARVVENGLIQVNSGLFTPLANITDGNTANYASNTNIVGALANTGVSVLSDQTFPGGFRAGFVVEFTGGLLTAAVLNAITLRTLNNGSVVDTKTSATGLGVTLLGGSTSGKLYLNFASSGPFNEVQFLLNSGVNVSVNSLRVYYAMAFDPNCGNNENNNICEDQIAGPGTTVSYNGGLLNVLTSLTNPNNIIDGNKNTSAALGLPGGTTIADPPLPPIYVGVTDLFNVYPSGNKAGFVIRANSALLKADVLNNIKIQTYLFGQFVGEQTFNNGTGLLALNALPFGTDDKKKLEFTSPGKFNEVRLVFGSGIDVNTATVDIFYAYESGPSCSDCRNLLSNNSASPYTGSIVTGNNFPGCTIVEVLGTAINSCNWTGKFGLLSVLNTVSDAENAVTPTQDDFASVEVNVGAAGAGARLTVQSVGLQPANSFAGFEIAKDNSGLLGLLDVAALGGITIRAFNGTTQVDSESGVSLLNAGVLTGTGGKTVVGFRPNGQYNRLVFEVNSGLVSADIEYRVYNAFVILDTDGDGTPDCIDQCAGSDALDSDGDGIPDNCDQATCVSPNNNKLASIDTDGDGIFNNCDIDSDNDGIPDTVEDTNGDNDPNNDDQDGDGIPNYLDLDSDNDGILDLYESGLTTVQISTNDPDGNGVLNGQNPVAVVTPRDTDGDSVPDYLDLDSDNDGIKDLTESGRTGLTDANNDGVVDGPDGDNDGVQDSADGAPATFGSPGTGTIRNTDGDAVPDYRDLDSDNDGIKDLTESGITGATDANDDGVVDGPDADGDGIRDSVDSDDVIFGSPGVVVLTDTDSDTVPNYLDLDSDNDGIKDLYESGQTGFADADGNGVLDTGAGTDDDNDGIQNSVDTEDGTFGSPGGPALKDTDSDTVPNYLDLDSDNDGIKDLYESGLPNPGSFDTVDNNGVIDTGTDVDMDGIQDSVDEQTSGPNAFGSTDLAAPIDTDGDVVPDVNDLDSDNDGINDIIENGDPAITDADGNGMVEGADGDNDGIRGPADKNDGLFGSPNTPAPLNSDNDDSPNFQDLDSDNDSVSDLVESGDPNAIDDSPEDGVVDDSDDTDGDGIQDSVDNAPGTFGDAGSPAPQDTDPANNDGPDYIDTDSDGDGTNDIMENGNGNLDGNNDGKIDDATDTDNDGIADVVDEKPGMFGGLSQAAGLPDLVPTIATNSAIYVQNQQRDMVITITNASANATTAPVEFEISKVLPAFGISISPDATTSTVSGEPTVANGDWTITEQGGRFVLRLKDGLSIPGNSSRKVVIQITASTTAKANARITVNIFLGTGGGETPTTNDTAIYGLNIE